MDTLAVLKYGNQTLLNTLQDLPDDQWQTGGVCGVWSVKEIIAHLATYEYMLVDALNTCLDGGPTPMLDKMSQHGDAFNDLVVAEYKDQSAGEVLADYNNTFERAMQLAGRIPADTFRQVGTIPWYGEEYALNDLIVYAFYGHKREHSAQVAVFLDTLK